MAVNTHNIRIPYGRHKGELFTRIPVSYLKWMVNSEQNMADIAKAELERRGTVTPDFDISGHAIDRVSLSCRDIWHESRNENEGIHAWLIRMAAEALKVEPDRKNRRHYNMMKFCFEMDGVWPVLKTVIRAKG